MRTRTFGIIMSGLIVGLVAGTTTPAVAQIGIGVVGGVSIADLHGSEKDVLFPGTNRGTRSGFVGGAFLDLGLGNILSIRPEVLYVQKGVKFTNSGGELKFKLDYVEIPVLLVFGIPTPGIVRPEIFVGPQVAFQTKCDVEGVFTGPCDDPAIDLATESTDFGILFGASVRISSFMITGAFDYGLVTLDTDVDPFDIQTQAFYIMAGWMFSLP